VSPKLRRLIGEIYFLQMINTKKLGFEVIADDKWRDDLFNRNK